MLRNTFSLDWCYPRTCAGCGCPDPDAGTALCWECRAAVVFCRPPWCDRCGRPVPGPIDHDYVCHDCSAHPPCFSRARSCALYDGTVRRLLRAMKYRAALWVSAEIGPWLVAAASTLYGERTFDAVLGVPLHPSRRRERSFNQADCLARHVAAGLGLPLARRALARRRPTPSQTRLTAAARLSNVRGAFEAGSPRWLEGRRVLLIDDIMTTGATVNECTRALLDGGATEVAVLTAARG